MLNLPTPLLTVRYTDMKPGARFGFRTNVGASFGHAFVIGSQDEYSSYGPFQCCGSQVVHGFSGRFRNEREKEDLLCLWLRTRGDWLSWYGIAASYQWPGHKQEKVETTEVMEFLIDLGAKLVDERPNKYHEPHQMCLFVLDLIPSNDNLKKYVTCLGDDRNASKDLFNHKPKVWVPNWWAKLDEKQQKEWLEQRKVSLKTEEEAELKRKEQARKADENRRVWDFAFGQQQGPGHLGHVDLEAVAKTLKSYQETRMISTCVANFKKFIEIVEGK